MTDNLIPYEEFPKYWNPDRLKPLFNSMTVAGVVGMIVGIVYDDRRITAASTASAGAGIVGQTILTLFRD